MTRFRLVVAAAASGLALGLILTTLGLPYGRMSPAAFAELYHGSTDTTGFLHVAVDCDGTAGGTQENCFYTQPTVDIDITLANSTGASVTVVAFNFRVITDETILDPVPAVSTPPHLNGNPDANDGLLSSGGWSCGPVNPLPDQDPNPAVAASFISCIDVTMAGFPLPDDPAHKWLATVHYTAVAVGPAAIDLANVDVYDSTGSQVHSCNPATTAPGPCFGATVEVLSLNDFDLDGVPDAADNCPTHYNPDQSNSYDGNFISNAPLLLVNDVTRANSDTIGDACDPDPDNDGLPGQAVEGSVCGGNPYDFDTDGDLYYDGAECALGTDPTDPDSKPTAATCGSIMDNDGDRLPDRWEVCFYNTNPGVMDTDGDGMRDACEAVPLNADAIVNSGDQLLFQTIHLGVLAGGPGLANADFNKDGNYNSGDQLAMAWLIVPLGQCP